MIELTADVREELVAHAHEGAPMEVCGIVAGVTRDEDARVAAVERVPNVATSPETRYELDPERQMRAMHALEDAGHDVVGFYHSHPRGPARPSATDVAQAAWPGHRYVIVSLGDSGDLGSWMWDGERFRSETVRTVQ